MAVSKYKTWVPNEILTAADLNASFDQVFNNQGSFGYPRDGISDFNGFELILDADGDTSISTEVDDRIDFKLAGQDLVIFDGTVVSPVNGLTLVAAATGNAPQILAHGLDTNIGITLTPKGTGVVTIGGPLLADLNGGALTLDADGDSTLSASADDVVALRLQGVDAFIFDGDVAGSAHGITFTTAAAGADVMAVASGAGADINLAVTAKGAGTLKLSGGAVTINGGTVTATPTANAVVVANASGNLANGWISSANVDQHADFVLLSVANPAAASSVDLDSTVITSTYAQYRIDYSLTVSADDTEINLRTDTSNGASVDAGATDYSFVIDVRNTTGAGADADPGAAMLSLQDRAANSGIGNASPESVEGYVWVRHLGNATHYPSFEYGDVHLDNSTRTTKQIGAGHRRSAAAINFIRVFPTSGTMTGTVRLYGLKAA